MFIVSSYLPIRYLLIAKGKMVTLQWINLIGSPTSKWSKFTSPGMRCMNVM